jgi:dTDP-glucose 4,6-dehydratase
MTYQPRNVLVTGGAGFIGCNYVRYLLATEPTVWIVNLDALTYAGSLANLQGLPDPVRHTFVHGDICDRPLLDRLLREHDIDTVVHLAAESHVDRSIAGPAAFIRSNVVGTSVLLEACREHWLLEQKLSHERAAAVRRFHHVSTDEVYGSLAPDDAPFTESTRYAPNSPYAASKAGSDHLVRAFFRTYGLPVTISHASNNYGPWQHAEKLIPTVIRSCMAKAAIPIYGDGSNRRDWLHVEDHCRGIAQVLARGTVGEIYHLGGGDQWSNIELARMICGIFDAEEPAAAPHERLITFVADRPGHDWRYAVDFSKAEHELGWKPQHSLRDSMPAIIRHRRQQVRADPQEQAKDPGAGFAAGVATASE